MNFFQTSNGAWKILSHSKSTIRLFDFLSKKKVGHFEATEKQIEGDFLFLYDENGVKAVDMKTSKMLAEFPIKYESNCEYKCFYRKGQYFLARIVQKKRGKGPYVVNLYNCKSPQKCLLSATILTFRFSGYSVGMTQTGSFYINTSPSTYVYFPEKTTDGYSFVKSYSTGQHCDTLTNRKNTFIVQDSWFCVKYFDEKSKDFVDYITGRCDSVSNDLRYYSTKDKDNRNCIVVSKDTGKVVLRRPCRDCDSCRFTFSTITGHVVHAKTNSENTIFECTWFFSLSFFEQYALPLCQSIKLSSDAIVEILTLIAQKQMSNLGLVKKDNRKLKTKILNLVLVARKAAKDN